MYQWYVCAHLYRTQHELCVMYMLLRKMGGKCKSDRGFNGVGKADEVADEHGTYKQKSKGPRLGNRTPDHLHPKEVSYP